mgnify:CR=1 FL=1
MNLSGFFSSTFASGKKSFFSFSWNFFKGSPGVFRVKQHAFIETKGMNVKDDMKNILDQTFEIIHSELFNDAKYMKDTNRLK